MHGEDRRGRITQSEVESDKRIAGTPYVTDVEWATLDPQGNISFIKVGGSDVTVASD
jgi:uncharacterized membrane protein YcaP (DUF421 family)